MKKLVIMIFTIALVIIALPTNADNTLGLCDAAPVSISGPSSIDWNAGSQVYTTQIVCDVVEYEWVLNLGTSCPLSQTTTSRSVQVAPCDFVIGHSATDCCGTWTISVRAKVDNGVDPPFWTSYITKTVTVTGC